MSLSLQRRIVLLFLVVAAAGCAPATRPPAADGEGLVRTRFPGLPEDATRVVEKLAACTHFSGEFGGDNSARDREVTAAITQLGCQTIDQDVKAILLKYPGDKSLIAALKIASEL